MKKILLILCFITLVSFGYLVFATGASDVAYPITISYQEGESVASFAKKLKERGVIRNEKLFRVLFVLSGSDRTLKPNNYAFSESQTLFEVVRFITSESKNTKGVRVVIPEGSTNREIAVIVSRTFPGLDVSSIRNAKEGSFFPDTYFFPQNVKVLDIQTKLETTFREKTDALFTGVSEDAKREAVIMASLLEKEGRGYEERQTIAGILYKRMKLDMPLQVDATFLYTLGKGSESLTVDDLQKDGPYNTYTRKGLPPGPIGNPGLESLEAALNPISSPYLYYLHDSKGVIHYAKDFEEHKNNKAKYLK